MPKMYRRLSSLRPCFSITLAPESPGKELISVPLCDLCASVVSLFSDRLGSLRYKVCLFLQPSV